jgi:O-antigen/teichoic acid export membrane protein
MRREGRSTRATGRVAGHLAAISIAQRAITFANFIVLPLLLPVSEMGALAAALAIATMLTVLGDMGIQVAASRMLAASLHGEHRPEHVLGAALVTRAVQGVVASAIGLGILYVAPFDTEVRRIGLVTLLWVLNPLTTVYTAVLQTYLAAGRLAVLTLASAVCSTGASLGLAAATRSGVAAALGLFGTLFAFGPAYALVGRRFVSAQIGDFATISRALTRTAWGLGLSALIYNLYNRVDTLVLSLTAAARQVAVYYAGYRFAEIVYIVTVLAVMAIFPLLARLYFEDVDRARRFALQMLRVIVAAGLVLATAGPLLSRAVIETLYGPRYEPAALLMAILMMGTPFTALTYCITQTAVAFGHPRIVMRGAIAGLVTTLATVVILIPTLEAKGAAIATVITNLAGLLAVLPWGLRTLRISVPDIARRAAVAVFFAGGALALSQAVSPWIAAACALPTAALALGAVRIGTASDYRQLARMAGRVEGEAV